MNGSDWALEKYDAGYVDTIFKASVSPTAVRFDHVYSNGATYPSREALTWTAPAGEYITEISFYRAHSTDPAGFDEVLYTMGRSEFLSSTTGIDWQASGYGYSTGNVTLTFTPEQNVQKAGLGFNIGYGSSPGWWVDFERATITTAPEPATLVLITMGGLGLMHRRLV
jgi:hypothetical protein